MSNIRDYITHNLITSSPAESIEGIAKKMKENNISAIILIEGKKLAGIITERDLVQKVLATGLDKNLPVRDVMTKNVMTGSPDMNLVKCVTMMLSKKIKQLPIVENGKLVGIVCQTDLIKVLSYR